MHEKKMESIINRLSKIIDKSPKSFSDNLSKNWRSFEVGGIHVYLIGENLDAYNELLEELLNKEKWGAKFSEKYVDEVLKNSIFGILEGGIDKAKEDFAVICHTIETYSIEQTIHIPLGGISMYDIEELSLGKVKITRVTEATLKEILAATKAITRATKNSPEEQDFFIQKDNEYLSREFLEKICAVYRVVAEPDRANELAERETQRALDLLRYSIPALYDREDVFRIDLSSQTPSSYQPTLTLSSVGFVQNRRRLTRNYELSANNLEILKKIRVFELSGILRKPNNELNEFEKSLLRGLHWFAGSQTQVEIENEFLNLTTCLEVFFTPKGRDPISNSIAEGVALVLSKDLIERKNLKRRVKELYGYRSKVSHGKHISILNKDLDDLKQISMFLLVKMVERKEEFASIEDLINWLEEQKLS
jgi:hypothetical protein